MSFAEDKQAKDIVALELTNISSIADFFLICSADSTTQVKAIAEHIKDSFKKIGILPLRTEGVNYAHWILLDYGDVVIHIFEENTRHYYQLERLWIDAPRLVIQ